MDVVTQRDNELSRVAIDGRLVADDQQCRFLVIQERTGGTWAIYPHGVGKLGIVLCCADVAKPDSNVEDRDCPGCRDCMRYCPDCAREAARWSAELPDPVSAAPGGRLEPAL